MAPPDVSVNIMFRPYSGRVQTMLDIHVTGGMDSIIAVNNYLHRHQS